MPAFFFVFFFAILIKILTKIHIWRPLLLGRWGIIATLCKKTVFLLLIGSACDGHHIHQPLLWQYTPDFCKKGPGLQTALFDKLGRRNSGLNHS